jgi:hypothetical protein
MAAKKKTAIVKVANALMSIDTAQRIFGDAVEALASRFDASVKLKPAELAEAFVAAKDFKGVIERIEKVGRDRVLEIVTTKGEVVPDTKGSRTLVNNGWKLEARAQGGALDEKKVEALLRAKNLDPTRGMDAVITFTANTEKLSQLVMDGALHLDELETCKKPITYAVQTPKRIEEGEDE